MNVPELQNKGAAQLQKRLPKDSKDSCRQYGSRQAEIGGTSRAKKCFVNVF